MEKKLSKLQAYNVMLRFLELFFLKSNSDDIGDLLSDSEFFWEGKTTADPASWVKWEKAINLTIKQNENQLTGIQAFQAMLNYIKIYRSLWNESKDLDELIEEIQVLYQEYNINNVMWVEWFKIINEVYTMQDPRMQKESIN